jgi:hypothetical protein
MREMGTWAPKRDPKNINRLHGDSLTEWGRPSIKTSGFYLERDRKKSDSRHKTIDGVIKIDNLVKRPFCPFFVIPAKAGIQGF